MSDKTTPLYVVCSPCRCVGKTLLARLLTEFHVLADRPVAAFDLADEGPQLIDYLPQFTTVAEIGDILGQMALFERLIADTDGANIIDVSHRTFENFFTVVEAIGFFEEARRRSIEPLILFIIDANPKSPTAYASLQRRFTEASLLPVRTGMDSGAIADGDAPAGASGPPPALEIPQLGFSLRALIDQQTFSFGEFWRATPARLPGPLDDELRDWVEDIFVQFRKLELTLGCADAATPIAAPPARRPRTAYRPAAIGQHPSGVPEAVRRFAPKKALGAGNPIEEPGGAIVEMLQKAGEQLRAAEDRINRLETEVERAQNRAVRAEGWLERVEKEIEEKLVKPATAARSKIDELDR